MMTKIAYFDCYSGASGDMLLGALLDNTVNFNWFYSEIQKLNLPENLFELEKTYVNRSSISSCKINIAINQKEHHHRNYSAICNIMDTSDIADEAKALSKKIFYKVAEAEAKVHNKSIDEIHFHEVGALDSIIDITGFSICYTSLNIDKCVISPVPVGSGIIYCAHGCLPVPAPATLEILKNSDLCVQQNTHINEECLTPTAAAILATIMNECGNFPELDKIISTGYGAGNKVFPGDVTSNLRFVLAEKAY